MGCFSTPPQGSTSVSYCEFFDTTGFPHTPSFFKRIPEMTNNAKFRGINTSYFFYCLETYLQARGVGDTEYELDMILF